MRTSIGVGISMLNRTEARRLYKALLETLATLANRLFESTEGEFFGVDPEDARQAVPPLVRTAGDLLLAMAHLHPITVGLQAECDEAVRAGMTDPFLQVELPNQPASWLPDEDYWISLAFRSLADRLAFIYGLQPRPEDYIFASDSQKLLFRICERLGQTVEHLLTKKSIKAPFREDHIKHVLYSVCYAAFPDALPDGQIVFRRILKGYKPDLGVPGLKACVELKVVRSRAELSVAIDDIIIDQSAYGSDDYTTFISLIYTNDTTVDQSLVDTALLEKAALLGSNPLYAWIPIVTHGLLLASRND